MNEYWIPVKRVGLDQISVFSYWVGRMLLVVFAVEISFRFLRGFWGIGEFEAEEGRPLFLVLAVWLWKFPYRFPGAG